MQNVDRCVARRQFVRDFSGAIRGIVINHEEIDRGGKF